MIASLGWAGLEESFYLNRRSNVNSPCSRHKIMPPVLEPFGLFKGKEKKENPHCLITLVTGNQI